MDRVLVILSGVFGFLGVGLGAFGAHGLRRSLEGLEDAARRLEWWETAARYHLMHALAIGLCAWLASRGEGLGARVAGLCFAAGIVVFSGSLYTMTITGVRWLGAVTPFGGLFLMAGWACVIWAALRP
ncbi:DUF423 domain-containing protein [Sandaracinus amylolyticus]|uniref:DUF423 domain-containing protein n=1 Tax=Sandaracinus amylolyticus TaxID=927083 RepID=UPI001F49162E|nr:DUF423 domain-containing protein [Sandaracinus amylolyticus]UJR79692.1 DUF423 domain-containing protein [Sandaracinus amylolyticus]